MDKSFKPVHKDQSIDRKHVKFWDGKHHQKFVDLSGSFSRDQDKKYKIDSEVYYMMNTFSQRSTIKSIDNNYNQLYNSIFSSKNNSLVKGLKQRSR